MIKQTLLAACVLMSALAPTIASAQRYRGNQAEITQVGNGNAAAAAQTGAANNARIYQRGNGSTATVTQEGNRNSGCVYQLGNNLETHLVQEGNGARTTVVETNRGREVGRTVIRGKRIFWCE